MNNRFLDAEEKFYNYGTSDVEDSDIFDIHKASNSDAQQVLDGDPYWRNEKNTYSEIIYMSPKDYFETCARDCFDEPVDMLIKSRRNDKNTLEHLRQVLLKYKKKFPITYINYATHRTPSQEGLHRMMVAGDLFGWDTKFPVQIIKWVDKDKAAAEKELKHNREIERYLDIAIDRALRYKYYNIDELKDQLKSEFETEVRYVDEFDGKDFVLELEPVDTETIIVTVNDKYKSQFDIDKVMFIDKIATDSDALEDIDFDDLSDWMKDLLNDINLKNECLKEHYVIVEEFLTSKELINQLKEEFGVDYYKKPLCKEVCMFIKNLCPKCEVLDFMISVWKYTDYQLEPISRQGHCVIRYDNKLYDYTSNQYADYDITESLEQPRILEYDSRLSDVFGAKVYRDLDYVISM